VPLSPFAATLAEWLRRSVKQNMLAGLFHTVYWLWRDTYTGCSVRPCFWAFGIFTFTE